MIRWLLGILVGWCAHSWKVAVERELPSIAEEGRKNGVPIQYWDRNACSKRVVVVMTCDKCGGIVTKEFTNW
jgi:hypothetical protein